MLDNALQKELAAVTIIIELLAENSLIDLIYHNRITATLPIKPELRLKINILNENTCCRRNHGERIGKAEKGECASKEAIM